MVETEQAVINAETQKDLESLKSDIRDLYKVTKEQTTQISELKDVTRTIVVSGKVVGIAFGILWAVTQFVFPLINK